MKEPIKIDVAFVRNRFDYDPITGNISFRGSNDEVTLRELNTGNVTVRIKDLPGYEERKNPVELVGGRLAWALYTGEDPGEREVQYLNHDQTDLRFENLLLGDAITRGISNRLGGNAIQNKDGTITPHITHKGISRRLGRVNTVEEKDAVIRGVRSVIKEATLSGQDTVAAFLEYCKVHSRRTRVQEVPNAAV